MAVKDWGPYLHPEKGMKKFKAEVDPELEDLDIPKHATYYFRNYEEMMDAKVHGFINDGGVCMIEGELVVVL